MLAAIADSIASWSHPGAPSIPRTRICGERPNAWRLPYSFRHHIASVSTRFTRFDASADRAEGLGGAFTYRGPPFAGKSFALTESLLRPSRGAPILAVGPETQPSGGRHGGTANIL